MQLIRVGSEVRVPARLSADRGPVYRVARVHPAVGGAPLRFELDGIPGLWAHDELERVSTLRVGGATVIRTGCGRFELANGERFDSLDDAARQLRIAQ